MEELAKSKNTPGTNAAFDLLGRVAVDPETDQRFPDGTILLPADSPDASALMSRAINERKPIAIVFPDGSDMLIGPPPPTVSPSSWWYPFSGLQITCAASETGRLSCLASG